MNIRRQVTSLKMCWADVPFKLQEITLTRLIAFLVSSFMLGVAHAMEVQDGTFPEPNYLGILMTLVLMVGSGVWLYRQIMRKDKQDTQATQSHAKHPK